MTDPGPTTRDTVLERGLAARRETLDARIDDLITACRKALRESEDGDPPLNVILKRAKVPLRSFYRLFSSKDELFVAVLERGISDALAAADLEDAASRTPEERIDRWVHGFVAKVYSEPGRLGASLLLQQTRLQQRFPAETEALRLQLLAPLADAIAEIRDSDVEAVAFDARLVYSMVSATVCDRLIDEKHLEDHELTQMCAAAHRIAEG